MTTASDDPDSAEITAQDDLAVRKTLGPYDLKKKLGQGGMGAVYLAVDPEKKEQLALKILPREKAANPQLVKRFKAEAQNAAQLQHENIVGVFGTGEADGYLYIALEYIDGIDVHDLVQKRGVLPVKRSIDIIKQVARALQHAHEQHIVHRDIKPANLLIRRDGVVKLADMGLARAVDESVETGITRAGTTVGTVDYMSPEQARNSKSADVRSDIYSLGCTWYHMLTGRPPFCEGSLTNKLHAHAKQPPPDPRTANANVPEGVVAVIHRMMAKNPDDRYQTPQELIKDLEGALVNKEAVSRKILEGIVDDEPEQPVEESPPGVTYSQSRAGRKHLPSNQDEDPEPVGDDEYAVRPPAWSDSAEETETPPDEPLRPSKKAPAQAKHSSTQKGAAPVGPGTRHVPEDPHLTIVPTKPVATVTKPATSTKGSNEPTKSVEVTSRVATNKGNRSQASNSSGGPSHSLPPPRRRAETEAVAGPPMQVSPKKLATIIGGIAGGLVLLWVLISWINRTWMGDQALIVATNPFDGNAPPPPPAPVVPGNEIPPAADVPSAPGQVTVKDVLLEKKDMLASSTVMGPGNRTGSKGAPGIELVGPGLRNAANAEWMDQPLQQTSAPFVSIRKGAVVETERQYPNLNLALKSLARDGGQLVLYDEGPYDLAPTEYSGGMLSIKAAAAGFRPRIRLIKDNENNRPPGIKITDGSLLLDGVDIICDADSGPGDQPWVWIQVTDGSIYVKQSSLTLVGQRKSGSTTALQLLGKATGTAASSRFLFDESVVRGEGLQAIQLESAAMDAVVRNSLIIAGDAAAITVRYSQKPNTDATRKLRLVSSTINSRRQALTLNSTNVAIPAPIEVSLEDALLAVSEPSTQSVFLKLDDWPEAKPRVGDAGPFKNLSWSSKGSAVLGFNSLVSSSADASKNVADAAGWKQLWKQSTGMTFSSSHWPTNLKTPIFENPLKSWSPKTLESLPIAFAGTDHIPGCRIGNLRAPDLAVADSVATEQNLRPRVPATFAAKVIQQVDPAKTDLGKLIASKTWDDGTVFVVSGSGTRSSSPILIEGRRIRIQFNQTDGPPLVINPKGGGRPGEHAAFITVRGGQLDLEQGSFAYDSKDTQSIAPWFMNVEGGSFIVHNCRVVAPLSAGTRSKGLIRWAPGNAVGNSKSTGEFSAYGQIVDSLLVGNGTLGSLELADMAFVAKNCAFVARQHLFEITPRPGTGVSPPTFDAQNCTYLVAGTQFTVLSSANDAAKSPSLRIYHQDCVFATTATDAASKTGALMMNVVGAGTAPDAVKWIEESCGYVMDLKAFYLATPTVSNGPVPAQDFNEQWVQRWGKNRVERYLRAIDGVLFEKNFVNTSPQVKPENLTLHKSAQAKTWSETGGQIGVRPESLEPPSASSRISPNPKKSGTPGFKL